jgi:hypothetical protein
MVKCGVLLEVRTEFLHNIYTNFGFEGLNGADFISNISQQAYNVRYIISNEIQGELMVIQSTFALCLQCWKIKATQAKPSSKECKPPPIHGLYHYSLAKFRLHCSVRQRKQSGANKRTSVQQDSAASGLRWQFWLTMSRNMHRVAGFELATVACPA